MNKTELLRDVGIIGVLWTTILLVIFDMPGVAVTTKDQLAVGESIGTLIAVPIYFGWEKIRARPSLFVSTGIGIIGIGLMLYMAYLVDNLGGSFGNGFQSTVSSLLHESMCSQQFLSYSAFTCTIGPQKTAVSVVMEWRKPARRRSRKNMSP